MEAKLQRQGEVTVVRLSGKIELETNHSFRDVCLRQFANQKVVFCMREVQFVGSSGIQAFFRALGEIHAGSRHGIKVAGVQGDFLRLFQHTGVTGLEIHESSDLAVRSFLAGLEGVQFVGAGDRSDATGTEDDVRNS